MLDFAYSALKIFFQKSQKACLKDGTCIFIDRWINKLKSELKRYFYSLVTDERRGLVAGILKTLLLLCSFFYRLGIKLILMSYKVGLSRAHRLGCKVISVGNITWGGTGKTPLVQMLTEKLAVQGREPSILIRGYGEDEDRFLKETSLDRPVLVGRDRLKNGQKAVGEYGSDSILLDDGFQHWRIERDVDILTINSLDPFGNGHLIPRGILREPLAGIRRADLFILTKTDLVKEEGLLNIKERLRKLKPDALIVESIHRPICLYGIAKEERMELDLIIDEPVATLSGIGDPTSFQRTVEIIGAKVVLNFAFLDHYRYTAKDLKKVIDICNKSKVKTIVTTEKDVVRLRDLMEGDELRTKLVTFCGGNYGPQILALHIQLKITNGEEKLDDLLSTVFSS